MEGCFKIDKLFLFLLILASGFITTLFLSSSHPNQMNLITPKQQHFCKRNKGKKIEDIIYILNHDILHLFSDE